MSHGEMQLVASVVKSAFEDAIKPIPAMKLENFELDMQKKFSSLAKGLDEKEHISLTKKYKTMLNHYKEAHNNINDIMSGRSFFENGWHKIWCSLVGVEDDCVVEHYKEEVKNKLKEKEEYAQKEYRPFSENVTFYK